ncbi:uncharacterized protein LOC121697414 isoform X2 [Alosa sapidissima]|nr:uncharacterized protein LOC121697414 isoform X2 [Alosa sapidissima]
MNVVTQSIQSDIEVTLSKTRSCLGGETTKMKTDVVGPKEEVTPKKLEPASNIDLKEIEMYFSALEQDQRRLQQLLQEEREEQEMELTALKREKCRREPGGERGDGERGCPAVCSKIYGCQQTEVDEGTQGPVSHSGEYHTPGCSNCSEQRGEYQEKHAKTSSASKDMKADRLDLKELMELEQRVRKAEVKKQLKALAKAEKKARKAERSSGKRVAKNTERKDDKVKDINPNRSWHRYICTMGCATSHRED